GRDGLRGHGVRPGRTILDLDVPLGRWTESTRARGHAPGWYQSGEASMNKPRIRSRRRPCRVVSLRTPEHLEARALLSTNAIVQENQLTGTPQSQWNIVTGSGNPNLQGFATDISVQTGQTISFKIKDVNQGAYNINIYRAGYYQSDGARLVATIPSSQALQINQPAPISDPTTGEVDAGNWSVAASWTAIDPTTSQNATSGIYFANLVPT